MKKPCVLAILMVATIGSIAQGQLLKARSGDWPWWRGPAGNGLAAKGPAAPVSWSETLNVAWKVDIPGRGHSSPTVVGSRIILATSDDSAKVQSVICLDRKTGAQRWQRVINQGGYPDRINPKNTHASSTIACDGTRLFATFLHHDAIHVTALSLRGEKLWEKNAGEFKPNQYRNGYAASPILYGKNVIVACDFDGNGFLAAFERESGKLVWKTPRPARVNYSSPVIARIGGRDQLLISGCDMVASYDPATGKQVWTTAATTMATAGTMVWDGDLVFASGGFPRAETVCVRADGSGEVVWRNNQKCYEQSMLAYNGHIYAMSDSGIMFCWQAATGKERWRERLRGPVSASPVLSNGNIYVTNEAGTTWVIRAHPEKFDLVAKNQLGTIAFASPTICGGEIYVRVADQVDGQRQESVYCLKRKR